MSEIIAPHHAKSISLLLGETCQNLGAELLFAVESGSRAWGFESPNSDYDVRFVYKRPLSWYLSIDSRRDVIELPLIDKLYDINGWDIKKALYQIARSNPAFFEWLESPVTYFANVQVKHDLSRLATTYFNPRTAIYHYLHMASGNYREYLRGDKVRLKKYFYVIRPLLACIWLKQNSTMPPVLFDGLFYEDAFHANDKAVFHAICDLRLAKMKTEEMGEGPRVDLLNEWIERKLNEFAEIAKTTAKNSKMPDDLNEYFYHVIMDRS